MRPNLGLFIAAAGVLGLAIVELWIVATFTIKLWGVG